MFGHLRLSLVSASTNCPGIAKCKWLYHRLFELGAFSNVPFFSLLFGFVGIYVVKARVGCLQIKQFHWSALCVCLSGVFSVVIIIVAIVIIISISKCNNTVPIFMKEIFFLLLTSSLSLVGFICIIDACLSKRIENIYLVIQVWNCESVLSLPSSKYILVAVCIFSTIY